MAAGADSPEASGNAVKRLQATMMKRVMAATTRDGRVAAQLAWVLVLRDPPTSLMRPTVPWRVMIKTLRLDLAPVTGRFRLGSFGQVHDVLDSSESVQPVTGRYVRLL
jgi:hypothetical protein